MMAVMDAEIVLPLGLVAKLEFDMCSGIYLCMASGILLIVACHCLNWPLRSESTAIPKPAFASKWPIAWWWLHALTAVVVIVCLAIWCTVDFFSVGWGGLASDLLEPTSFSGISLIGKLFKNHPVFAVGLIITVILAPLAQVIGASHVVFGKSSATIKGLLEFGNSFSLVDVLFLSFLGAILEMNDILQWIVTNQFGKLCDDVQAVLGTGCASTDLTFDWVGTIALFVMTGACLILMLSSALSLAVPDLSKPSASDHPGLLDA
jgi:hypothetical protein